MSIGAIQHEVRKLEADGLLRRRRLGNLVLLSLDTDHPLYEELAGVVAKSIGIAPALSETLGAIKGVRMAFLYGSYVSLLAKSTKQKAWSGASDVDLLVIGEVDAKALASAVREIGRRNRREVNYTLLGVREFRRKVTGRDSFLEDVLSKPIVPLAGFSKRDYKSPVRRRADDLLKLLEQTP